ncbi:unannotated protein [freshwater metagenome]|uniref:Unannotated protein n=1 Tax=freshwater metagenome TaxID=449393 RepID=A0A6J6I196_9ZZZZ
MTSRRPCCVFYKCPCNREKCFTGIIGNRNRYGYMSRTIWRHLWHTQCSRFYIATIYYQLPCRFIRRHITKPLTITNHKVWIFFLAAQFDRNGSMYPRQLTHGGVWCHVGMNKTISHKVAIVWCVTKLSAIRKTCGAVIEILREAMVFPFPHKATLQSLGVFKCMPVIGK